MSTSRGFGLAVWFSLRVREVPGSIPGIPRSSQHTKLWRKGVIHLFVLCLNKHLYKRLAYCRTLLYYQQNEQTKKQTNKTFGVGNFSKKRRISVESSLQRILANLRPALEQGCGRNKQKNKSKRQALAFYFCIRIWYMFWGPKCRGNWDLGLYAQLRELPKKCGCAVPTFDFKTCLVAKFVGSRHRPWSQLPLHFDSQNIYQIQMQK